MSYPRYFNKLVFTVSLLVICASLSSCSGFGDADVKIRNGIPCFTVTEKYFRRANGKMAFGGFLIREKDKADVWGYYILRPVPLLEDSCFLYGALPEDAKIDNDRNGMPLPINAPPLKTNTLYEVGLRAGSLDTTDHIGHYRTEFCLQKDDNGNLIAQRVDHATSQCPPPE
jgi:hypothetical protein